MRGPDASEAVRLLEEALRVDLERCRSAIVSGEKERGLASLESAFAKLDTALDLVRSAPQREVMR